jgi:Uma2 family endonuclease
MGLAKQVKRFTPQEYYALEREAGYKSDFYAGEIFAMAGGTVQHSLISANLTREVGLQLKEKPCRVFESNLRVAVKATGLRCYPDVSVFCGPLEYDDEDPEHETLTNPIVLFEVLSKSTEGFDRGLKSESYRRIPSLQAYLLVRQDAPRIEILERQSDGTWVLREAAGLEASMEIRSLQISLPFAEVYARVDFAGASDE